MRERVLWRAGQKSKGTLKNKNAPLEPVKVQSVL